MGKLKRIVSGITALLIAFTVCLSSSTILNVKAEETTARLSATAYTYDVSAGFNGSFGVKSTVLAQDQYVSANSKLTDVVKLPDAPEIIKGVTTKWHVYQINWDAETNKEVDEYCGLADDFTISELGNNLRIRALPEGYYPVSVSCPRVLNDEVSYGYVSEWVEANSTDDILKHVRDKYSADAKKIFSDADFEINNLYMFADGVVRVNCVTNTVKLYIEGKYISDNDSELIAKAYRFAEKEYSIGSLPTSDEIKSLYNDQKVPSDSTKYLTFQGWNVNTDDYITRMLDNIKTGGIYTIEVANASYNKNAYVAHYYLDNESSDESEHIKTSIDLFEKDVDSEDVLEILKSRTPGGFTNWELEEYENYRRLGLNKYYFVTKGDKVSSEVTPPENEKDPFEAEEAKIEVTKDSDGKVHVDSTVAFDTTATKTTNGVTTLSNEAVSNVAQLVANTIEQAKKADGEVVTPKVKVNMADATVIPTDILNAAKGQDVDVEFVMTGDDGKEYGWTINGNSINGSDLSNVNLKVNKGTSNVPAAIIGDSAATGMPNIQINLADHGLFGFTAALKIYVGTEYAGQYANLLYYTDGRLEIQNSCPVDSNGYTTLEFTHASDYVIAMGDNLVKEAESIAPANDNLKKAAPKTGDDTNIMMYLTLLILGGATIAGTIVYRRKVQR